MATDRSEYKLDKNELLRSYIQRYSKSLLQWDLEDLSSDVEQLGKLTENRFEVPIEERIRFSWRSKLNEQVRRYEELEEIGKFLGKGTTPWELFCYPLKDIPSRISESDDRAQKLTIINRWVSIFWADCVSNYVFGMFPATVLLSASCIELMLDGVALRDDEDLYRKIKGKPGGKKLKEFPPRKLDRRIKSKIEEVFDKRGKIIAHSVQIIEKDKKLWEILTHKRGWDESTACSEYEGAQILFEFKGLAKEVLKSAMEILSYLERLSLKQS